MSNEAIFKRKVGGKIEIEPEEVKDVRKVNGACSELVLEGGKVEGVKGNFYKAMEKLERDVKPEGLEELEGNWVEKDRRLKTFTNS